MKSPVMYRTAICLIFIAGALAMGSLLIWLHLTQPANYLLVQRNTTLGFISLVIVTLLALNHPSSRDLEGES
ncbi:hypothetical protein [Saccharopolyspora griseoalba]|uniref:Uncharacterized protein n=1 Tax=Saccharopolyspora griseoalba TaxID=1431848 RepID=A0ABW2LPZ7_9PSEU